MDVAQTISASEVETLLHLMPSYLQYMEEHADSSLLCRFYGCFSLKVPPTVAALVEYVYVYAAPSSTFARPDMCDSPMVRWRLLALPLTSCSSETCFLTRRGTV